MKVNDFPTHKKKKVKEKIFQLNVDYLKVNYHFMLICFFPSLFFNFEMIQLNVDYLQYQINHRENSKKRYGALRFRPSDQSMRMNRKKTVISSTSPISSELSITSPMTPMFSHYWKSNSISKGKTPPKHPDSNEGSSSTPSPRFSTETYNCRRG